MTQRLEIQLTGDPDGTDIGAGKGETISFALDGTFYEIDLTNKNATALRRALSGYIRSARPVRATRGRPKRAARSDARRSRLGHVRTDLTSPIVAASPSASASRTWRSTARVLTPERLLSRRAHFGLSDPQASRCTARGGSTGVG